MRRQLLFSGIGLKVCIAALMLMLSSAAVIGAEKDESGTQPRKVSMGELELIACGSAGGYCEILARPLDPNGRVSGTIKIAFEFYSRLSRTAPALGTIVGVEGGPGFSTTNARNSHLALFRPIRDQRDLLLVDNRGTGRSGAIGCEPLQSMVGQTAKAVGACGRALGDAAGFYGTGLAADDLAAVLSALGIGKIDLYSDSYGTFFGQTFAARHPERLRSLVLDSAYPVIGEDPFYGAAGAAVRRNLEILCRRAPNCANIPGTSLERIGRLLDRVRSRPIRGEAHDFEGELIQVTIDPVSIGMILFNAASGGLNDRELDPAARALLDADDAAPLLRLVAENISVQGDGRPGGPPDEYSRGLNAAASCLDYPQLYDMTAIPAERHRQAAARIAAKQIEDPGVYAPLTIAEWLRLPLDLSLLNLCVEWPLPVRPYPPGHPIPAGAQLPDVPTLVLSGELDAITTPEEGRLVARQFRRATQVLLANSFHVVALGDVDGCASHLVQTFIRDLSVGDAACAGGIRPTRMPPPFPRHAADVPPATAGPGNAVPPSGLAFASAAVQTGADALVRWSLSRGGQGVGLRGGSFRTGWIGSIAGVRLDRVRWTEDLAVSGLVMWDRESASISAHVELEGPGLHRGSMDVSWSGRGEQAWALLTGTIDGEVLVASTSAPRPAAPGRPGR